MDRLKTINQIKKHEQRIAILIAALAGAAIFIYLYGIRVVDPTYTEWIFNGDGDLGQHYFGWAFYRNADWAFPVGMMDTLGYPYPTSVLYLDAIPLFAVVFKLLSPILPNTFQYLGLWGLLSYMLQGGLSAAICSKYTRSGIQTVLSSLLFIVSPILMFRMFYHTALASHWMILLGLLLVLRHDTLSKKPWRALCLWALMGVLSAGIHQYYLLFCGVLCFGYSLYEILRKKRWYGFLPCVIFLASGILTDYILGAFTANVTLSAGGFTEYSFNLNGFFNPHYNSRLFENLPILNGQYEGYAYLGAGIFLLFLAALVAILIDYQTRPNDVSSFREDLRKRRLTSFIFGIICLIFLILALSPKVTFYDKVLFQWTPPAFILSIWELFRSSGRLIWPVCYIITIAAVIWCVRHQSRRAGAIVLAICALVQFYDMGSYMGRMHDEYRNAQYTSPLTQRYWDDLASDTELKHLVISNSIGVENSLYPLADAAIQNKWTLNNFYFARSVEGVYDTFDKTLENPGEDTIVVVPSEEYSRVATDKFDYLYELDGFVIALNRPHEALPKFDFKAHMETINIIGDDQNLSEGKDIGTVRYLYPGGFSCGPYVTLFPGEYHVTIKGTNLDLVDFDCVTNYGDITFELSDIEVTESEIRYHFTLQEITDIMEFRVFNNDASATVIITDFAIA